MTIPERFYRIARHKLGEIRDRLDQLDQEVELSPEELERLRKQKNRADARRELEDATAEPAGSGRSSAVDVAPTPLKGQGKLRTPEEIRAGSRLPAAPPTSGAYEQNTQPNPLEYHYKLLGVEVGADYTEVQSAYNKLVVRCDPGRFPTGSEDARTAQELRDRLESSFKVLRDALDLTARRFDLLEFDKPSPAPDTQTP